MRNAVVEAFCTWSALFEGRVSHMYLDTKGLVTVGVGNLIDPVQQAVYLPFRRRDGTLALMSEIQAEWSKIKTDKRLAQAGHLAAAKVATLHLDADAIDRLVLGKLAQNWAYLKKAYWPNCDEWPACAQLAVSSMAWAVGAGFPKIFKTFKRSADEQKWKGCAEQCQIKAPGDKAVARRNAANRALLLRAATQESSQYDELEGVADV